MNFFFYNCTQKIPQLYCPCLLERMVERAGFIMHLWAFIVLYNCYAFEFPADSLQQVGLKTLTQSLTWSPLTTSQLSYGLIMSVSQRGFSQFFTAVVMFRQKRKKRQDRVCTWSTSQSSDVHTHVSSYLFCATEQTLLLSAVWLVKTKSFVS